MTGWNSRPAGSRGPSASAIGTTATRYIRGQPAIDPSDPSNPLNEGFSAPVVTTGGLGGLLSGIGGGGPTSGTIDTSGTNGITSSGGGWNIDVNGNLISGSLLGSIGRTLWNFGQRGLGLLPKFGGGDPASAPPARTGPYPIAHTTSVPGEVAATMAQTRARNIA